MSVTLAAHMAVNVTFNLPATGDSTFLPSMPEPRPVHRKRPNGTPAPHPKRHNVGTVA